MDRADILAVVVKHMRQNISDLSDTEIDPNRSMMDYGAESLDVVEIVSSSMRELDLKIPRTELVDLQNINGLVDAFAAAKQAQA